MRCVGSYALRGLFKTIELSTDCSCFDCQNVRTLTVTCHLQAFDFMQGNSSKKISFKSFVIANVALNINRIPNL